MTDQILTSQQEDRFQRGAHREESVVVVFSAFDHAAWAAQLNLDVVQNKDPSMYRQGPRSH